MTQARVWTLNMILGALCAVMCLVTHQWIGAIGSSLGIISAYAARDFLIKLDTKALVE